MIQPSTSSLSDSNPHQLNIAVIGAGAFGTAVAEVAARNGNKVKLLARKQEVVDSINHKHINPYYLSEFTLNDNITACLSIDEALENCELLILAIPTQLVPSWLEEIKDKLPPDLLICNTSKGLYLAENCLLTDAIFRHLGRDQPYAILSGPSFAQEMMMNFPTAGTFALLMPCETL